MNTELVFALVLVSTVSGDTIPSSEPSFYPYSINGYEGETVQFQCHLSTLGDPPVRWSWFCGQEQMTNRITYSTTFTYLTFKLSMKYHMKYCFCRATSPSYRLVYNRSSSHQLINVNHSPSSKPKIFALSSTTVRSGETIQAKCNLSSLGYPQVSLWWFCSNQAPVYGTNIRFESYLSLNVKSNDKTIGCRCRAVSSNAYYEYDEFSDTVHFTILSEDAPQSLSPVAFGTTSGLLLATIIALSVVVILQCRRKRIHKGTNETKSNDKIGHNNPVYSNDPSYETLRTSSGQIQTKESSIKVKQEEDNYTEF